ncbi:MAG: N-6 DNA methylase, partial [Candidatus Bathyarchaeia archaeon]
TRYIYILYTLKPESIKEELFGRIYQIGLPPETRKNLGAFFTKPEAAKLLASLAVERWDEKVLDPACGSGTLLAESYQAKARLAKKQAMAGLDKNLIDDLVGIDIMHFARELTSINLALQNPLVRVTPKVFIGDGIEKMVFAKSIEDPPVQMPIYNFLEGLKAEYEALILPREGIDIVIMNPPFTRRERIPEKERERLDRLLGNIVRGKVGYSLYFFAAADNVIKPCGKLGAVTPEEFFAGGSAESVRRYLFSERGRIYVPKYIIRSAAETAFSEGAHYRDYLAIYRKQMNVDDEDTMVFVILKKRLAELNLEKVIEQIIKFSKSDEEKLINDDISARKIHNVSSLISKHINNLKPLVGLNYLKAQELIMELLEDLSQNPTFNEYKDKGIIKLRDYTCQHTTLGVEEYVRRLFISRYGGRGKISFVYEAEDDRNLFLSLRRGQRDFSFKVDKADCVYSLRSPAGVVHMNITDEEEYALSNTKDLPDDMLRLAGLVDKRKIRKAVKDIKSAYEDLAGNILLVRRSRLTSPNIFWLAFFSQRKIIGPSAPMICLKVDDLGIDNSKLLTLYLNSSITLLQLLGFAVETEGAWLAFQGDRVWSNIHLPDFSQISENVRNDALKKFNEVGKLNVNNLYQRVKEKDPIQKSIDVTSLKLLGINDLWVNRLDEIYDSILGELKIMQKILEDSSRKSGIKRKDEVKETQKRQKMLDTFF